MIGSGVRSGSDGATIDLAFADGSIGTIHYWTNGPKSFPKERYEVFCGGRALVLHNWRKLESFGWSGVPRMRMAQDKGHRAEIAGFLQAVAGDHAPLVALDDLVLVSRTTFAARDSVATGGVVDLAAEGNARR